MAAPQYRHRVETSTGTRFTVLYDGTDPADAMAAWSKAISDGAEYAVLESLIMGGRKATSPSGS